MSATHVACVDPAYMTTRGPWYHVSCKADEGRSGRIVVNIGIRLLNLLCHLFGNPTASIVRERADGRAARFLNFPGTRVRWFFSPEEADLPSGWPGVSLPATCGRRLARWVRLISIASVTADAVRDFAGPGWPIDRRGREASPVPHLRRREH